MHTSHVWTTNGPDIKKGWYVIHPSRMSHHGSDLNSNVKVTRSCLEAITIHAMIATWFVREVISMCVRLRRMVVKLFKPYC